MLNVFSSKRKIGGLRKYPIKRYRPSEGAPRESEHRRYVVAVMTDPKRVLAEQFRGMETLVHRMASWTWEMKECIRRHEILLMIATPR